MSVYKQGELWYMRFQVRGRRIHEPTYARTKAAALKKEAERRLELLDRGDVKTERTPTLEGFAPQFVQFVTDSNNLKPNTKRCYMNGLRLLKQTPLMHRRLNDIWPSDVDTLTFPGSGSNANQAIRTLHRILSFAVERKYLQSAPSIALRTERKRKATVETWLEELLLELAPPTLHDFVIIMLDSGMRPEEIARLEWEHVLWDERAIMVLFGKSHKAERFVPLSERMAAVLRNRKHGSTSRWVFPSRKDTHVHPTSVGGHMWQDTLRAARDAAADRGLPKIPDGLVLYSCRHTFASRFLKESRNDRAALKEIMGHSSFAITERYVHPGISDAASIVDRMNTNGRKVRQMGKRA